MVSAEFRILPSRNFTISTVPATSSEKQSLLDKYLELVQASERSFSINDTPEKLVQTIRRKTRKKHYPEEKIHIVLEGSRGGESIAEQCGREGIAQSQYYSWSKDFLKVGKQPLAGDTKREFNSREMTKLRKENTQLKALQNT